METPLKKKQNIPGAYIEDEQGKVGKKLFPLNTRNLNSSQRKKMLHQNSKKKKYYGKKQDLTQHTVKNKDIKKENTEAQEVMSQIIKKVLDQKINLTLEKTLIISPKVINKLKSIITEERNSINSLETKFINHHLEYYEQPILHYSCGLGFMQVYLGEEGHQIMELVDTGSESNIIPKDSEIKAGLTKRLLNMNIRGIGVHCSSIVGLEEFTPIPLVTGEERNIQLFVGEGEVHTVLGRPFLADNKSILEFY
ncbi:hypothetical protein O181_004402 [Austropuccinia psidii MF-1]|uniref:Peptidase A2 domain-containing protein n=1 Tax=Austropuccinia psidii MF-1 TaxID=1389203 RepID=A0A9Q3BGQ5_9BASI|nr:hypothetical protein [Austropuccinia psidii MF-1]